jgi:hypothetical protein
MGFELIMMMMMMMIIIIIDSFLILNFALVRSKVDFASVTRNCVSITDSTNLEQMQRKFAAFSTVYFSKYSIPYEIFSNRL